MRKVVLFVFLASLAWSARAQRVCATTEVNQLNKSSEQIRLEKEAFEEWLIQKRPTLQQQSALQGLSGTTIYKIPVVIHVIHNGEAYGTGFNITDEQIASQLEVINNDYRHLNADSVNTPTVFQSLMADVGFEFILAKRDPSGLPTNGITRTNGNNTGWTFADNSVLKSVSYWSTNDYLNIWVAPLSGNLLGWAEFPTSTIIDGVNEVANNDALTDGVVITTKAFGSSSTYPQGNYKANFNLGRTLTHELGHFFGLRHISGDGNCTVDDFVVDTPNTKAYYFDCPPAGSTINSCNPEPSMFMNYMDLVNDDCMNLFSLGQKDRMLIVLNNSPRRASLLTSLALDPPPPLDAAVIDLPSPGVGICDDHIFPTVTIQNTGMVAISQLELSLSIDDIEVVRQNFIVSLDTNQDTTLALPDFFLSQFGDLKFTARILSTNNIQDDIPGNDIFDKQIFFSEVITGLNEDFNIWPQSWAVRTDAPVSKWNFSKAPNLQIENTAAVLNYYQQNSAFADHLISPVIDLRSYAQPYLLFDYAYGQVIGYDDVLAVLVSLDCGNTFQDTVFINSGAMLATTERPVKFTPSGPIDWQTSVIDLANYINQPIHLAFVGRSGGGNNIYLDNFKIVDNDYQDVSIKGLVNESGAFVASINEIGLIIENTGVKTVDNLDIEVVEDNNLLFTQSFNNLNLLSGQRQVISLANNFNRGLHNLRFKLVLNDANTSNNELSTTVNFLESSEQIPFRERFNNGTWNEENNWTITSPIDNNTWQLWPESSSDYLYYPAFQPGKIGLRDWLVLPQFDFSQTKYASIQYRIAYSSNDNNNELLRIWVSTNLGESFDYNVETLTGKQMATNVSTADWFPVLANDWSKRFIDLSEFAGERNVLIAFEVIDGDGSNVYIDDIELFVSNEATDIEIDDNQLAIYPNPVTDIYTKLTFNLTEKQDINIRIIDANGKTISNQVFPDILNQTLPLEVSGLENGIYIVQAAGVSFTDIRRIMVIN
jgi:Pregnancy-associated plasma protein-A/Secretion system C-terminal sorting domain